ncbi:MAG: helix-turn-helix domain-containing protein [Campylobacteraceae bacterium]|jgi:phage repressor protein C with HTH and peptisase S24 domain|nr:helix-turn-helix domain-containing protein [Campylobacteraceae bacterium]
MNDIEAVLKRLKDHFHVETYVDLAPKINVVYGTIPNWIQRGSIPYRTLKRIANNEGISFNWLLTGDINDNDMGSLKAYLYNKEKQESGKKPEYVYFRYYSNIEASAGHGVENIYDESNIIYMPKSIMPKSNDSVDVIRVKGDSMSPTINDGDLVFVDKKNIDVVSGKIYVIKIENEVFIKRLLKIPGQIIVRSDNKDTYPDFNFKEDCVIIGRVIYRVEEI